MGGNGMRKAIIILLAIVLCVTLAIGVAGNEIGDFERIFAVGMTARLFAYPNEGYELLGWFDENDELVSADATYTFVMERRNVSLVAKWRYVG